jgi:hypothetical protein
MEDKSIKLDSVIEYINDVFKVNTLSAKESRCELCNLTKRTNWYYENEKWIICDCKTCHRPMILYKEHTMFIELLDWVTILAKVLELFGNKVTLRFKQRKIRNHFHIHIYGVER